MVPENADLNDYKTPGTYYIYSDAMESIQNKPEDIMSYVEPGLPNPGGCVLIVDTYGTSASYLRMTLDGWNGNRYMRRGDFTSGSNWTSNGGWDTWRTDYYDINYFDIIQYFDIFSGGTARILRVNRLVQIYFTDCTLNRNIASGERVKYNLSSTLPFWSLAGKRFQPTLAYLLLYIENRLLNKTIRVEFDYENNEIEFYNVSNSQINSGTTLTGNGVWCTINNN